MAALPFRHLPETPSTQDALSELLQSGAIHGASVLADRQTAGRGRQGREWESPAGNYAASIWLHTAQIPLAKRVLLSYLAGIVLHEQISPLLPEAATLYLKWPNDLLLNGEKLAGILIEPAGEGHRVGIGLNLTEGPKGETRYPAVALAQYVDDIPTASALHQSILPALLNAFDQWQQKGDDWLLQRWQQIAQPKGTPVRVQAADGREIRGEIHGLAPSGGLQIIQMDRSVETLTAGDILPTLPEESL